MIFCPDQLGPAVHRLAPDAGTQVVYPTFGSPAMVDWVDYAKRNENANPLAFARTALQRARGHTIWLVYAIGYPTLAGGCSLSTRRSRSPAAAPIVALHPHAAFEKDTVAEFLRELAGRDAWSALWQVVSTVHRAAPDPTVPPLR